MPPKPQQFKTPDGKVFSTKSEWRDYMVETFYSFKNKVNESLPLIKNPGEIDGQSFDIGDCDNSTLAILDVSEQVQIDVVKNSRVFIGACSSSIFIRNCENCVFYTCCRQLRLREVVDCTFYVFSMAEVHIEYSNNLKFAPFNGGYPEQAQHFKAANLDISRNLWYDIFDHNDPLKTKSNWSLLPENEYETPWFPQGQACDMAIPRTLPNSVARVEEAASSSSMQSFGFQQLVEDSKALDLDIPPTPSALDSAANVEPISALPPPVPVPTNTDEPETINAAVFAHLSNEDQITQLIKIYATLSEESQLIGCVTNDFVTVLPNGSSVSLRDTAAVFPRLGDVSVKVELIKVSQSTDMAWSFFWITNGSDKARCTGLLSKAAESKWQFYLVQRNVIS